MLLTDTGLADWLQLVRAEYDEFPALHLTKPQVRRLWNLDEATCDAVIQTLESQRFLRRTPSAAYVRNDG